MAFENAVSALGKVMEFHPNCVDASMGGAYLQALPIKADTGERSWVDVLVGGHGVVGLVMRRGAGS